MNKILILAILLFGFQSCNTNKPKSVDELINETKPAKEKIEEKVEEPKKLPKGVIGSWTFHMMGTTIDMTMIIKEKNGKYFLNYVGSDTPNKTPEDLPLSKNGNKFKKNNSTDYYIINADKTLSVYDDIGFIRKVNPDK